MVEKKTIKSRDPQKPDFLWYNLVRPKKAELQELILRYSIPDYFLTDPLDIDERARVEEDSASILCILRIPVKVVTESAPFITVPLGIIIVQNVMITICAINTTLIKQLFEDKNSKGLNNVNLFFQILRRTALFYLQYLKDINSQTMIIEKELQASLKNQELIGLLNAEKSLVYFTTSLRSNEIMFNRLVKVKSISAYIEEIDFDDILIEYRQAIEMTNVYSNILSGMMDAFASVISNNLNMVMKVLTSLTVILMLPTLIASYYGMNVPLPFQDSPHAFLITIGFSVILTAAGVIFLIRRRFF